MFPLALTYSPSLKGVSKENRDCLFDDENSKTDAFQAYSQENCFYQCQVSKLLSNKTFSCVPWDLPNVKASLPVCNSNATYHFKQQLSLVNVTLFCSHCKPDCENTIYDTQVDTTFIDPERVCQQKEILEKVFEAEELLMFENKLSVELNYLQGDFAANKLCRLKMVTDIVLLDIQVATSGIIQVNQAKSSSFVDQLSVIGGSLSLFIGCSIFIIFELLQLMLFMATSHNISYSSQSLHEKETGAASTIKSHLLMYCQFVTPSSRLPSDYYQKQKY